MLSNYFIVTYSFFNDYVALFIDEEDEEEYIEEEEQQMEEDEDMVEEGIESGFDEEGDDFINVEDD